MQLWTDYEGVTIDGAFPLKKLLLPEGRSAFFSTANGKGEPVVLRLIECHFDEEEILARWRCIEALNHPNFLKLERYGQIEIDSSPVVYAVFERVDANLAGVLDGGNLSVKDTAQLSASLASALEMLHTHGFVHGQVTAGNIFAVGDVVKLRSDCIREAAEGEAGVAAKRRDVHDLSVVMLEALTRRQSLEGLPESAVPQPFDRIIRGGMSGSWGLTEIRATLEGRSKPAPQVTNGREPAGTPHQAELFPAAREIKKPAPKTEEAEPWADNVVRSRMRQEVFEDENDSYFSAQTKWLGIAGLAFVLLLFSFWFIARAWNGSKATAPHVVAESEPAAKTVAPKKLVAPTKAMAPKIAAPRTAVDAAPAASAADRVQWRVIAYTYNRREDAQKRADALAQKRGDLQPSVFSLKGRAPFLVTVGGAMSKDAAFALARRARSLGLPRDTYAQNYTNSPR